MTKPLRAALYARFSTDLQRDASIEDQLRSCRAFATKQGIEVVEVYSDRAVSGASLMRSGMQKMLRDSQAGHFDIVFSEAMDRLSRSQSDIAAIFERFQFRGIMIETLSEGLLSELHIGMKGTMNAIFLKDLGIKTRRGLMGRALAGKCAGGKAYGYKNLIKYTEAGDPIKGERAIIPFEAATINRIFTDYAKGISPKKIAGLLNAEQIPGPTGKGWGPSTLHGNRERGTGILNNELYVGVQVWNRLSYAKDPDTGKRVSRLNPEADWVTSQVPQLRIVDQPLWDAVRARQGALKSKGTNTPIWDRRRPRTLFSGMLKCGCCEGGFSKVSQTQFGCSTARNKGKELCGNMKTISQIDLEHHVLNALQNNLMDKDALTVFGTEYAKERNRLMAEADNGRDALTTELATVTRDLSKLVDAIIAGIPADQVKERMNTLTQRKTALETQLATTPNADKIRIHPKMALTYRDKVSVLIDQLGKPDHMAEAKEALRGLIDRIVLSPNAVTGDLDIKIEGALACLLSLSLGSRYKNGLSIDTQAFDVTNELLLVAGVGFEPTTFRL
jgi:site-specific DNA recombinase